MYFWLAVAHRTPRLWSVIVHESGRYTFGQTVFYVSHFLREVPVDVAMALFIVAAAGAHGLLDGPRPPDRRLAVVFTLAAMAVVAGSLAGAAATNGWDLTWRDLLQYRTRDEESAPGSHWNYHLLSTLWFALGVSPVVRAGLAAVGVSGPAAPRPPRWPAFASWIFVAVVTLICGVSSLAWTSSRYTGHEARELITHVPVTLLLSLGCIVGLARSTVLPVDRPGVWTRVAQAIGTDRLRWVALVAIPLLLVVQSLRGGVMSQGQSSGGLVAMIAGHFFEHSLDYVFTSLVACALATVAAGRRGEMAER
jgi:hypothetical protein